MNDIDALRAVADANRILAAAGLPTIDDLNKAVTAGMGEPIGYSKDAERALREGWQLAMDRVFTMMQASIVAQRKLEGGELSAGDGKELRRERFVGFDRNSADGYGSWRT